MNINKKILDNLEVLKHTTFIEIAPNLYRELENETLRTLIAKNIDIVVNDKIKTYTFRPYKTDCFAYNHEKRNCNALRNIDCIGCRFYRTDLKMKDIEKDIKEYAQKI